MSKNLWKQMLAAGLLVLCYPLIWLYFKAKDVKEDAHCRQMGKP